jgi:hypothetical protein
VVKAVFVHWGDSEIYLSFDTSMLWTGRVTRLTDEYCIIRICVVHLGRAIPVRWGVLKHKSSSIKIETYQNLIKHISKLLPFTAKVILLANREFANAKLIPYVRQLSWHCRIRIKGNFWLLHSRQGWQRVSQFLVQWVMQN